MPEVTTTGGKLILMLLAQCSIFVFLSLLLVFQFYTFILFSFPAPDETTTEGNCKIEVTPIVIYSCAFKLICVLSLLELSM